MPGINSILSTAVGALRASQAGINVAANNLANASNEDHSRQIVDLRTVAPNITPDGVFGRGVSVENVTRIRDEFIDGTYRRQAGIAGESSARQQLLGRVETVLGEPGSTGVTDAFDRFFNSWSELATNPTNPTVRNLVRQSGQDLVDAFGRVADGLSTVRAEGESRLLDSIDRLNALLPEIGALNQEIVAQEGNGVQAPQLRDQRDALVDELASLVSIDVSRRSDGSIGVALDGINIVDGAAVQQLESRTVGADVAIAVTGRTSVISNAGGSIGGTLSFLNGDLADAQTTLDEVANALATDVNLLHRTGTTPDGSTNISFFDPAGTTARTLALDAAVLGDADRIAAGTPDAGGAYRSGANDIALGIADSRAQDSVTLGEGFTERIRGLVSDVGQAVRSSTDAAEVQSSLLGQIENRRAGVSGVSTDEELVTLIRYQTSYQAAARVISIADELLQTVVQL